MTKLENLLTKSKCVFHSEVRKELLPLSKYTGAVGDKINFALNEHPKGPAHFISLLVAPTCLQGGKPDSRWNSPTVYMIQGGCLTFVEFSFLICNVRIGPLWMSLSHTGNL